MRKTRKWLSAALALVMALLLVPVILPTAAEAADGYVSIKVNNADSATAKVGDIVTVTLSNKAMTVCTFTAGMSFDKTELECTGISQGSGYSAVIANAAVIDPQLSTMDEANGNGKVGFGVARTANQSVTAGTFLEVTFKVLKAGTITVTAYEISDGTNGVSSDNVGSVTITATEASTFLLGDVDNNGVVNLLDAIKIRQYLTNKTKYPLVVPEAANVDGNSTINLMDAIRIRQYLTNKTKYPLG